MTDDLSQLLDRAADETLWTPPLPAADLDRAREALTRSRRRRRGILAAGTTIAVAASAAAVVGFGGLLGTAGDDGGTAVEPPSTIIDYSGRNDGLGVEIDDPADVAELDGAPRDFTDFVAQALARADRVCAGAEDSAGGQVTVRMLRTGDAGVAVGSVGGCGGAMVLWAVDDGVWRQVEATQDVIACGPLYRYDVPGSFVGGECFSYGGDQRLHRYPSDDGG